MSGPRDGPRTAAVGALLALALLAPALVGDQTLAGYDLGLFNLPALELAASAWREGHAPGWNPLVGPGQPYVAEPSYYALDPRHLLLVVCRPLTALNVGLGLALALGWAGAWWLGRALGLSRSGAAVAAASFGLGGVQISHLGNPTWAAATGLLPWVLLATRAALAPGAGPATLVLAALPVAADLLGSAPEAAGHALVGAAALALVEGTPLRRAAPRLAAVALLAGGLAAVGAVPAAAVVGETDRGEGVSRAVATMWSLHPLELLGLLVPGLCADGAPLGLTGHLEAGQGGRAWFPTCYAGVSVVALAALALPAAGRDRRWRGLLVLAGVAGLYALGRFGPLQPLLWELAPPVRTFRYPAKAFGPVVLVVGLVAGLGVDLARRRPETARRAVWALGGLAAALACAALLAWSREPALGRRLAHAAAAGLAAAWALRRASRGQPAAGRLVAIVVTLDLLLAAWPLVILAPRRLYEQPPGLVAEVLRVERQDGAPARVATLASAFAVDLDVPGLGLGPAVRREVSWREALVPNAGAPYGLRSATSFSSLPPLRLARLRAALREARRPPAGHALLLGARLAVASAAAPEDAARLDPVVQRGPFVLGRVRGAPAWCGLASALSRAADLDDALRQVTDPAFDPRARSVVEDPRGETLGIVDGGPAGPPPRLLALTPDRVELEVQPSRRALLVVREGFAAGWSAAVDGEPAPLLAVDALFRGVPVEPGRRRVVLEYAAPGRGLGAALTGLTLLLALVLALRSVRGSRP